MTSKPASPAALLIRRDQLVYTKAQVAALVQMDETTVARALNCTDPKAWPPPLRGFRNGRARNAPWRIRHEALIDWLDRLEQSG